MSTKKEKVNPNDLKLGLVTYKIAWLKSVTEQKAISTLKFTHDISQIRNAWKQANGKSVRNYTKKDK